MSPRFAATPLALKLSRILVPIDFSDRCRRAAECAESLARRYGAELLLLHAVAPIEIPFGAAEALAYSGTDDITRKRVAEKAELLEHFRPVEPSPTTTRVVIESDPARAILRYTADRPCDLIVMPTHGYGALHRLVTGSVTAEVLRHAPCPVWTGPRVEPAATFQNVICALDLARAGRAVLAWAAAFAHDFGATLRIVHVISMATVRSGAIYFDPDWRAHVAHESRQHIAQLQHDLGTTAEVRIELGEIPEAVIGATRDMDADLLVIGRGPKSYSILRETNCPVVAV
jgi:nucleotide-binding universal stress UspA family protein